MIEYWRSSGHAFPEEDVDFSSKLDTDLYAHAKAKVAVQSLEVSRDGLQFVTFSSDRYTRVLLMPPALRLCCVQMFTNIVLLPVLRAILPCG